MIVRLRLLEVSVTWGLIGVGALNPETVLGAGPITVQGAPSLANAIADEVLPLANLNTAVTVMEMDKNGKPLIVSL